MIELIAIRPEMFQAWLSEQPIFTRNWLAAKQFTARSGQLELMPDQDGNLAQVLCGAEREDMYALAALAKALPVARYKLRCDVPSYVQADWLLGWKLAANRFDRYLDKSRASGTADKSRASGTADKSRQSGTADTSRESGNSGFAALEVEGLAPELSARIDIIASAVHRARAMVNTPAEDLGPEQMETLVAALAEQHGAEFRAVRGPALLEQNFPAIHAVGRASHRAPRLLELNWGKAGAPLLTIVGKGVCFDTGGLDMKASDGMALMKKDMGGAAIAIQLSAALMQARLPIRIQLLVPAVENAIGPNAYRPGDVIATRAGVSVEIGNTDAEGRVVLCDALTYAQEHHPDLLINFATLTGAARIALGPDLPALFTHDEALSEELLSAGVSVRDPLWRMPLHRPYKRMLASSIAELNNAGASRLAGCITAALYLDHFVAHKTAWIHIDTYCWNDYDQPGRPKGGACQSLRAVFELITRKFAV